MEIVVTPMCEKILLWAGISDYVVNKHPDMEKNADMAVVLSKRKTEIPSINIELNTFQQIKDGIYKVSKELNGNSITEDYINKIFEDYNKANEIIKNLDNICRKNSKINVKVYSIFLNDIVEDLGFNIIKDDGDSYELVICPDFMLDKINEDDDNYKIICVPSHANVWSDPIERAISRYSIILDNI